MTKQNATLIFVVGLAVLAGVVSLSVLRDDSQIHQEATITLHGIPIRYVIQDSVTFKDVEIGVWNEWTGEECRIEIQEEYSRTIDAHRVARMVADCFNSSLLEWKYDTPEEQEEFSYAYANVYAIQCDSRFEPLGWPGADDGTENCEVPDPREIDLQ